MLAATLSQISHYPLTSNISMSELADEEIVDGIFSDPVNLEIVEEILNRTVIEIRALFCTLRHQAAGRTSMTIAPTDFRTQGISAVLR
jgi:hypothetical protein